MLYLAELINHFLHPRIENYLNHYSVKNLFDLDKILINECFVFNTRVVKFILNRPQSEFKLFLNQKSIEFIRELFFLAIGNSYGQFEAYRTNLIFLQEIVKDHDLQMNNEPTLKTHEVAYTSSRQ